MATVKELEWQIFNTIVSLRKRKKQPKMDTIYCIFCKTMELFLFSVNKKEKYFLLPRYQTTNLLKTRSLFLVCKKGLKEDKRKFVTMSVLIIVTIIFM